MGAVETDYSAQDLCQVALGFRIWGWSLFAVNGKRPLISWKRWQSRRPTDQEIGKMFMGCRVPTGLAVILGRISGSRDWVLGCRDFDEMEAYEAWVTANPILASEAPTVVTGRGCHVYFRWKGNEEYRKFPDGELIVRSNRYVILPPSLHPSGVRYRWLREPLSIDEFPMWDEDLVEIRKFCRNVQDKKNRPKEGINTINALCTTRQSFDDESDTNGVPFHTVSEELREVVLRNLPNAMGQRNGCIFRLVRGLRGVNPDTRVEEWRAVVQEWYRRAVRVIGTKDWGTTWSDFVRAWEILPQPTSESRPLRAFGQGAAVWREGDSQRAILEGCRAMARVTGEPFYLSARTVATLTNISAITAHRHLKQLVEKGYLVVVRRGRSSATDRRATSYRLG